MNAHNSSTTPRISIDGISPVNQSMTAPVKSRRSRLAKSEKKQPSVHVDTFIRNIPASKQTQRTNAALSNEAVLDEWQEMGRLAMAATIKVVETIQDVYGRAKSVMVAAKHILLARNWPAFLPGRYKKYTLKKGVVTNADFKARAGAMGLISVLILGLYFWPVNATTDAAAPAMTKDTTSAQQAVVPIAPAAATQASCLNCRPHFSGTPNDTAQAITPVTTPQVTEMKPVDTPSPSQPAQPTQNTPATTEPTPPAEDQNSTEPQTPPSQGGVTPEPTPPPSQGGTTPTPTTPPPATSDAEPLLSTPILVIETPPLLQVL